MKQDMLVGDLVQHVDDRCIGIIIGRRKKKYLGQDTLIIFFSDNKKVALLWATFCFTENLI